MDMATALATAARKERRRTAREVFNDLDNLSRTRALTGYESSVLLRVIRMIDSGRPDHPFLNPKRRTNWTPAMDERLIALRKQGKTWLQVGRGMGLTSTAVSSRADRLRGKGENI